MLPSSDPASVTNHQPHPAERASRVDAVVGHQDVVAPRHAQRRAPHVGDDVVGDRHTVGLVLQPGGCHILEPGALADPEARLPGAVDGVAVDQQVCRAALHVHAPVAGLFEGGPADVAVLDCYVVQCILGVEPGRADRAVFDVDAFDLVDFYHLLGRPGFAQGGDFDAQEVDVVAGGKLHHIAAPALLGRLRFARVWGGLVGVISKSGW